MMPTAQEIWMIIDDLDDQDLITEILQELKYNHKPVFFTTAQSFIEALDRSGEAPFIVLCEVNLPKTNGFVLRQQMLDRPNSKFHSVPFIFWSLQPTEEQIKQAFRLRAHGFFLKESSYTEWKATLIDIIRYWSKSLVPSKIPTAEAPQ